MEGQPMPTPAELAKTNSEHAHQRALFAWANMAARLGFKAAWDDRCYVEAGYGDATYGLYAEPTLPVMKRLFAIANGGARGDDQRSKAIRGGQLKAEGVKKGVPDVMLPAPWIDRRYCGLLIEMKRPKAEGQSQGKASAEQSDWIGYLRSVGYAVSVCFDWISAAKDIQSYVEAGGLHGVRSTKPAIADCPGPAV
jgi:hypothetical protein